MCYSEIVSSPDMFLYHSTRRAYLIAITRDGLMPNLDRDSNFGDYPIDGRLFVSTTLSGATWYADRLQELFDIEPNETSVLRFLKKMVMTNNDPYGNITDRYTTQNVSPEQIDVFENGNWVPLSSLSLESGWNL